MMQPQRLAALRRERDNALSEAQRLVSHGRHMEAEELLKPVLEEWRKHKAPNEEELQLLTMLGKSLEGQRKYVEAYELYSRALQGLTGAAYDEVYQQFLYLNERMGAFDKRPQCGYQ